MIVDNVDNVDKNIKIHKRRIETIIKKIML